MKPYVVLQNWWRGTGEDVETRATTESEVSAVEARYGVSLPPDFRDYLLCCSPAGYNMDAEYGYWWEPSRINNIPDEYQTDVNSAAVPDPSKHLFFVDHLMWSWAWAISCSDDATFGRVALIGGPDRVVAASFAEFVQRYTTDWTSLC